eukprot:15327689-Ditylum_brightwellii.AAC.1
MPLSSNSPIHSIPTTMTRNSPVVDQKLIHANTCATPPAQISTSILWPLDPSVLFCSPSATSVPTEYYSTQGRPLDSSRNQGPQADFPSILLRIFTVKI